MTTCDRQNLVCRCWLCGVNMDAHGAEIAALKRQIKFLTYYEIHDGAINTLTDELEARAESANDALIEAAVMNIRQLLQQKARAIAQRDAHAEAALEYMQSHDEEKARADKLQADLHELAKWERMRPALNAMSKAFDADPDNALYDNDEDVNVLAIWDQIR